VALVRTGVSEERSDSIIRETTFRELGTTLALEPNGVTFQKTAFFIVKTNKLPGL
jgi:hypothetical protein